MSADPMRDALVRSLQPRSRSRAQRVGSAIGASLGLLVRLAILAAVLFATARLLWPAQAWDYWRCIVAASVLEIAAWMLRRLAAGGAR